VSDRFKTHKNPNWVFGKGERQLEDKKKNNPGPGHYETVNYVGVLPSYETNNGIRNI